MVITTEITTMNMIKKTLFAAAIMTCTFSVFSAPGDEIKPTPDQKPCPAMMGPPPPAPVYAVTQQTDTPNDTLSNAVKNVPVIEKGKHYEVRIEVKELPLPPQKSPVPQP